MNGSLWLSFKRKVLHLTSTWWCSQISQAIYIKKKGFTDPLACRQALKIESGLNRDCLLKVSDMTLWHPPVFFLSPCEHIFLAWIDCRHSQKYRTTGGRFHYRAITKKYSRRRKIMSIIRCVWLRSFEPMQCNLKTHIQEWIRYQTSDVHSRMD